MWGNQSVTSPGGQSEGPHALFHVFYIQDRVLFSE